MESGVSFEEKPPVLVIDPTNMNARESEILVNFLKAAVLNDEEIFLAQGILTRKPNVYSVIVNGEPIQFELAKDILYSPKPSKGSDPKDRFIIFDRQQKIGGGGATGRLGGIYDVLGTLQIRESGKLWYTDRTTKKPMAVKVQITPPEEVHLAAKEQEILRKTPHHKAKNVVFQKLNDEIIASFIAMRKFPGVSLEKLLSPEKPVKHLEEDVEKKEKEAKEESKIDSFPEEQQAQSPLEKLSVADRLQLTINVVKALQKQIHQEGIIHNDIKPANIVVDLKNLAVNFIDVGGSRLTTDQDASPSFTDDYAPPEYLIENKGSKSIRDQRSDIYSTGITLSELWNATLDKDKVSVRTAKEKQDFTGLFSGITDLTGEENSTLRNLLDQMTAQDPDKRISLNKLINQLELLRHKHIVRHNPNEKVLLDRAYDAGQSTKLALEQLAKEDNVLLRDMARIISYNLDSFAKVNPNANAIQEFVNKLDCECLKEIKHSLTSIEEVKKAVNTIIMNYSEQLKNLNDLHARAKILLLQFSTQSHPDPERLGNIHALLEDINYIADKIAHHPHTLDDVAKLSNTMTEANLVLEQRFSVCKEQLEKSTNVDQFYLVDVFKNIGNKEIDMKTMANTLMRLIPETDLLITINNALNKVTQEDDQVRVAANKLRFALIEELSKKPDTESIRKQLLSDAIAYMDAKNHQTIATLLSQTYSPAEIKSIIDRASLDSFNHHLHPGPLTDIAKSGLQKLKIAVFQDIAGNKKLSDKEKRELGSAYLLDIIKNATNKNNYVTTIVNIAYNQSFLKNEFPKKTLYKIVETAQKKAWDNLIKKKSIIPEEYEALVKLFQMPTSFISLSDKFGKSYLDHFNERIKKGSLKIEEPVKSETKTFSSEHRSMNF